MPTPRFGQGSTATLDARFVEGGTGSLVDSDVAPTIDILDPSDVEIISNDAPTTHPSTGIYTYDFPVGIAAVLGLWTIRWNGVINGVAVENSESFEVVAAGSIDFPPLPGSGACSVWELDLECCELPDGTDPDLIAKWQAAATDILWAASGRRIGVCEVTLRPCVRRCGGGSGGWMPYKDASGAWRNFSACGCHDDCSCTALSEIVLPGPVSAIVEVLIDGVELDPSAYRLDKVGTGWRLVRIDGGVWPDCQDISADCDEMGAWCVTYMQGIDPNGAAIAAVSELTCELVKSCLPNCVCRLPANVTAKTSRGLTIAFDISQPWIRALPLVATWLDSVNPDGLTSESSVWSPDIHPIRQIVS